MKPEIESLLGGYSAGILTDEEQQELFRAALQDQEVYEALAAEQPLRDLLKRPEVRRELLEALEKPGLLTRVARWFADSRPVLASVAAALAVAVGGFLLLRHTPPQPTASPWSPSGSPGWPGVAPIGQRDDRLTRTEMLRRLLALPQRRPFNVELRLDRQGELPRYAVGEGLRLTFRAERESNILIVETRSDGAVVELFPGSRSVLPRVQAGIAQTLPPGGFAPLPVSGPAGRRVVRLIALPVGADPETLTTSQLQRLEPELAVVEATYDVMPSLR
jgi:hypothetical protein